MKRKFTGVVLFACSLTCVMGASSISFDPGQPVPNPKGAKQILSTTGTYVVDPAEKFVSINFGATETTTKQRSTVMANNNAAALTWDATLGLVPGTYDSLGVMLTTDANNNPVVSLTAVSKGTVVK